jgi:hypothetical protein
LLVTVDPDGHFWPPDGDEETLPDEYLCPDGRMHEPDVRPRCTRCGTIRDEARRRRGKSARRLGGDQERRIERVYGPWKVGEYGDPVDHVGRDFKWQSKASRIAPPLWLSSVREIAPLPSPAPAWITKPLLAMQGLYGRLFPLLIRSYVRQGVPTRDWIVVPSPAWNLLHADLPTPAAFLVMTGAHFLAVHGRDEA